LNGDFTADSSLYGDLSLITFSLFLGDFNKLDFLS